jgi:MoxR-like ATPase
MNDLDNMIKTNNIDFNQVKKNCDMIRKEISKIVVGYESVVDDLLICLITKGHMFMLGVPGIAKTTLAKSFSEITGLSWNRVQFTQDLLPADVIGHYYYNQKTGEFQLRKGPIFSEIVLADEINRAPPKTQSALIEAMQEKQVTIEGTTLKLPDPFIVIATKNPVETEGVYPLPEAQLDRFLYRVDMNYLEPGLELSMLKMKNENRTVKLEKIDKKVIQNLIGLHHNIFADKSVLEYILNIIAETRNNDKLVVGASPRAGEHLLYAAKAYALIHGRGYVIPDDVKAVVPKVLVHRIMLSAESEFEGLSTEKMIDEILNKVEVPEILVKQQSVKLDKIFSNMPQS